MRLSPAFHAAVLAASGLAALTTPVTAAVAQLSISLNIRVGSPPPPLPIYLQPALPAPDYLWAPGFWAWDDLWGDYYWVPGAWVLAPRPGLLWTPPWWGWDQGVYVFHPGYWGRHIGFYGGVVYGFGYTGAGYEGGYWQGPHFYYNSVVNRVTNVNITNVYQKQVIVNRTVINNVSYNGGSGGARAQPTADQLAAEREPHLRPTTLQAQHVQAAHSLPASFASVNHGAPPVAATPAAGRLNGPGIVHARAGGEFRPLKATPPPAAVLLRKPQSSGIVASGPPRPQGMGIVPPLRLYQPRGFDHATPQPSALRSPRQPDDMVVHPAGQNPLFRGNLGKQPPSQRPVPKPMSVPRSPKNSTHAPASRPVQPRQVEHAPPPKRSAPKSPKQEERHSST